MTAMASMSSQVRLASFRAFLMTGWMASRWERAAISGITPPYSAKISIWETTTLLKISVPFLTMAAAVSSQEVSMPRMFIWYIIAQYRGDLGHIE